MQNNEQTKEYGPRNVKERSAGDGGRNTDRPNVPFRQNKPSFLSVRSGNNLLAGLPRPMTGCVGGSTAVGQGLPYVLLPVHIKYVFLRLCRLL
jgi:hypothetical protein